MKAKWPMCSFLAVSIGAKAKEFSSVIRSCGMRFPRGEQLDVCQLDFEVSHLTEFSTIIDNVTYQ